MELRVPSYRLSFNGNPLLGFNCLGFLLRNIQLQDTILEFTMNVIFGNAVTDIEATAHRTAVTLLADVVALLVEYGYNIPAVSQKVQDKVKSAIENMTGLEVTDVNVRIAGVNVQSKSL